MIESQPEFDGTHRFYESRRAIRNQLLSNIAQFVLGIVIVIVGAMGGMATTIFISPVGAILSLFATLGIHAALSRAVHKEPRLTMSPEGIRDIFWGGVLIPWSAIKDVRYYSIDEQMIVQLVTGNDHFTRLKYRELLEPSTAEGQPSYLTFVDEAGWSPEDFQHLLKCAQSLREKYGPATPSA